MFLQILIIALFLGPALLVSVYQLALVLARLLGASAICGESNSSIHCFAVVIPAHDEEQSIAATLDSCAALSYPHDKLKVFVVADNCTDRTAEVARNHGATCLERRDPSNPGKGQALQWAFEHVLLGPCDAVVVLDADCRIDQRALRVFDQCLIDGSRVLQCNNIISNYDQAATSYVARIGQYLEYDFAYAPKSCLGLAVPLVGTGMVFHRSILEQYPWRATSVVEDIEYTLLLARHGIQVRFVTNVAVEKQPERRFDQIKVQRRRWARGTLRFSRREGVRLSFLGLATGRPRIADLGWTLMTMSRPLMLLHLTATVALAVLMAWWISDSFSLILLGGAVVALSGQLAYYATGIVGLGLSGPRLRLLATAPVVTAGLIWIAVRSLFDFRDPTWDRTPRTAESQVHGSSCHGAVERNQGSER